jgi:glutaredoxin-like protein NrdH
MLTVYSKTNCPNCDQTKAFLESKGIEHRIVKIDENAEARDFLLAQGFRSVPQIFTETELFVEGGYQGLIKLTEDELTTKLG